MTTDDTKQDLTEEVEPADVVDLDDEKLEAIAGGVGIGPFREIGLPNRQKTREEPKDGGVTGSW